MHASPLGSLSRFRPRHRGRQRGAALLTAMIIVTLVATLASAMVWQQWRAVQIEASERSRAQSAWILSGALDFAKLILYEQKSSTTALTDPWATPLAEARISTFLAADKANADDGPEAFLSGSIDDAQALYNLANLVVVGKADPGQIEILARLCQAVNIESGIAQRIADAMAAAMTGNSASAPLLPSTVAQLTWLGLDQASVQALAPYVILIPRNGTLMTTTLNVNTAAAEVLTAVTNMNSGTAAHLVQVRQGKPFTSVSDFMVQAGLSSGLSAATVAALTSQLGIHSDYFEVHGRLRLSDRVLVDTALMARGPNNGQFITLNRERSSTVE